MLITFAPWVSSSLCWVNKSTSSVITPSARCRMMAAKKDSSEVCFMEWGVGLRLCQWYADQVVTHASLSHFSTLSVILSVNRKCTKCSMKLLYLFLSGQSKTTGTLTFSWGLTLLCNVLHVSCTFKNKAVFVVYMVGGGEESLKKKNNCTTQQWKLWNHLKKKNKQTKNKTNKQKQNIKDPNGV